MKKCLRLLSALLLLSAGFSLGTQAFNIPVNARSLALSGSGIGGTDDPYANPAGIHNLRPSELGFSHNSWIGDISGNQVSLAWGKKRPFLLTLQSWNLEDIQLWGEVPQAEPLGTFGSHWIAAGITTGFRVKDYKAGLTLRSSLAKLYTASSSAVTLDGGLTRALNDHFSIGGTLKNIGVLSGSLKQSLPVVTGVGLVYRRAAQRLRFAADLTYDSAHGGIFSGGVQKGWAHFDFLAGILLSQDQTRVSSGFSFRYHRFEVTYGVAFHENSLLGLPQFLDFRLIL
ncbi:MAG: hypothetical protein GXO91_07465 [FCB group bacterium]|nr:hypothetical protein [FCB group bacterium]